MLSVSLVEMGFDSKLEFTPPAVLLGFSFALVPCCCHCCCLVIKSCPTLCGPMYCSPPGCSAHGDSPGENTGVGYHFLLQEIFPPCPCSLSTSSSLSLLRPEACTFTSLWHFWLHHLHLARPQAILNLNPGLFYS